MRRTVPRLAALPALLAGLLFLFTPPAPAAADIFRLVRGRLILIPGTEGITPGPGVQLNEWNPYPGTSASRTSGGG